MHLTLTSPTAIGRWWAVFLGYVDGGAHTIMNSLRAMHLFALERQLTPLLHWVCDMYDELIIADFDRERSVMWS